MDVEADLFLGAMDDISYTAHRFNINLNGKLILYTDGITEAFNKKDELYGKKRLLSFVNSNSELHGKQLIEALVNDVNKFAEGTEQSDDMTVVSFTRKGV